MAGSGQIAQYGAQITLNKLCGLEMPFIGTAQPTTWIPGQYWVNTTTTPPVIYGSSDGVTWNPAMGQRYLALLTLSPAGVTTVAGLVGNEVNTAGYARAPVTFSPASAAYPSVTFNSALVTWGPFTADMLQPALYVALVSSASGTTGSFLYWWTLPEPVQAPASQPIQIPTGGLIPGTGLILDQA